MSTILLTKITAVKSDVALSYHRVCGLYFVAVIFERTIIVIARCNMTNQKAK